MAATAQNGAGINSATGVGGSPLLRKVQLSLAPSPPQANMRVVLKLFRLRRPRPTSIFMKSSWLFYDSFRPFRICSK